MAVGGMAEDGAAAGVFQIITSGCGGGGSPWQPQCLQHPTTEGNRAAAALPASLSCCGLRNPCGCCVALRCTALLCATLRARGRLFPRTSAAAAAATRVLAPLLMESNKQRGIFVIRECTFRVFRRSPLMKRERRLFQTLSRRLFLVLFIIHDRGDDGGIRTTTGRCAHRYLQYFKVINSKVQSP